MRLEKYKSKKHPDGVKVVGKIDEFLEAGFNPDGLEIHEAKGTAILWFPDDDDLEVARAFIQKMEDERPKNAFQWLSSPLEAEKGNKQLMYLTEWMLNLNSKKPVTVRDISHLTDYSKEQAKLLLHFMFKDGWVDAEGHLTMKGKQLVDECHGGQQYWNAPPMDPDELAREVRKMKRRMKKASSDA